MSNETRGEQIPTWPKGAAGVLAVLASALLLVVGFVLYDISDSATYCKLHELCSEDAQVVAEMRQAGINVQDEPSKCSFTDYLLLHGTWDWNLNGYRVEAVELNRVGSPKLAAFLPRLPELKRLIARYRTPQELKNLAAAYPQYVVVDRP